MTIKVLKDALICQHENQLMLADVYFHDKIIEIRTDLNRTTSWNDIASKKDHDHFMKSFAKNNYPENAQIFDAKGQLLIPGAIDPHVHFNTPGFEFREDFEHGSHILRLFLS